LNRRIIGFLFLLISLGLFAPNLKSQERTAAKQPVAPVRPVTDDYYGTKIVDSYRYMENLQDPEVQAWMKAQNDYTRAVLARIPGREKLLARIEQLDQSGAAVEAWRLPGGLYLISKSAKFYLRYGLGGKDRLVIDPASVRVAAPNRGKGANAVLYDAVSQNNRYVAAGIAPGGSERDTEIHVFDTATGRETGDVIPRAPYSLFYGFGGLADKWLPDNRSFVYVQVPKLRPGTPVTDLEQKATCRLHVLGTNPQNDPVVFGYGAVASIHVDPRSACDVVITAGSNYVLGIIAPGLQNSEFYIEPTVDLGKTTSAWSKVADLSDDVSDVAIHGDDLYLLTYKDALRYKVIRTDARHPDVASAETVVPPTNAVVEALHPAQDALYVQLLDGGVERVLRVPYGARPRVEEVALPFTGTVRMQTDPRLPGVLIALISWTRGRQIYSYDPAKNQIIDTRLQPVGPYDNPSGIASAEVKVRSYDGTLVPLSIVYPKGMKLDGSNPTLLSGYGFNGVPILPSYDPTFLAWHEQGGIHAVCHVRGGGEYGEEWHLAGKGSNAPNKWRDFIACAEYLIRHKYTSPARLAGKGTSGGGIVIGRAVTSRPDLFAAAIDSVGVSDMLRFETMPHGMGLIPEVGSVKTKAGFEALYSISSYAHVKDGTKYPAVLLETGENDPRVAPWQVDKMAARLQAATSSGKPVLLRVSYHGGHQIIGGTEAQFQETLADEMSFLLWQLGDPAFQPKGEKQ